MLSNAVNTQYVDYTYYTDTYCGTTITDEDTFPRYARQAQALIDAITFGRIQRITEIPEEVMDAVCAAAEVAYEAGQKSGIIKAENIDAYSVTYGDTDSKSINNAMIAAATPYLANTGLLFRGTGRRKRK